LTHPGFFIPGTGICYNIISIQQKYWYKKNEIHIKYGTGTSLQQLAVSPIFTVEKNVDRHLPEDGQGPKSKIINVLVESC